MTRTGSSKAADKAFGEGRLMLARAYLKAAQNEAESADELAIGNPVISQIVNAAIAYTDALTAKFAGRVNQKDHASAVKMLREALGKRLPNAQVSRLRRILDEKDAAQYGARLKSRAEAVRLLDHVTEFARWAESEFARSR